MTRNDIMDRIEEMQEEAWNRNTGSNEADLDLREMLADWIMELCGWNEVCFECGVEYLTPEQKSKNRVVTFHTGTCCVCKERKLVTNTKYYNYLKR